jgi:hypothetical protein
MLALGVAVALAGACLLGVALTTTPGDVGSIVRGYFGLLGVVALTAGAIVVSFALALLPAQPSAARGPGAVFLGGESYRENARVETTARPGDNPLAGEVWEHDRFRFASRGKEPTLVSDVVAASVAAAAVVASMAALEGDSLTPALDSRGLAAALWLVLFALIGAARRPMTATTTISSSEIKLDYGGWHPFVRSRRVSRREAIRFGVGRMGPGRVRMVTLETRHGLIDWGFHSQAEQIVARLNHVLAHDQMKGDRSAASF